MTLVGGSSSPWQLSQGPGTKRAFVVVGAGFAALCESEAAAEAVLAASATPVTVETLVSALQGRPGAFVVAVAAGEATILLAARGDYGARLPRGDTERVFSGAGVHPWHLASFDEVGPLVLHAGDPRVHGPSEPLLRTGRVATARGSRIAANLHADSTDPGEDTLPVLGHRVVSAPTSAPPTALPYRVRVGTGAPIDLTAPVVFGRRPALPRGADGSAIALIAVPSPARTVSSTHLRVSQTGPTVIATDLRSTNGTTVHAPGFRARRLRQGESAVVVPGARIDIGDGNIVEILPVQAVSPPGIRPEEPR